MFEALFVLTLFGLLYIDFIEFLEWCDRHHTAAVQGVQLESQDTPRC